MEPKATAKQPQASKAPETQPLATEKPKDFLVVDPMTDPLIHSFPSTASTACRNLEDYLQMHKDKGWQVIGFVPQKIGRDTRNLLVFRKATAK